MTHQFLTFDRSPDGHKRYWETENKLADFENDPHDLKTVKTEGGEGAVVTYSEEAENFAVQQRFNKLKQHHRRAFNLISKALTEDWWRGRKQGRSNCWALQERKEIIEL